LQITSAGFQFLLHSPHAQLWDLLLEYLHMAEVSLICIGCGGETNMTRRAGTTYGCRRGPQFPVHDVYNGARESESTYSKLFML
jgi:hypothetical protein